MVVIVIGSLNTGIQTIHGPFLNCEQADDWASQFIGHALYTIVPLRSLDETDRVRKLKMD